MQKRKTDSSQKVEYAGFGRRFLAYFIDFGLLMIIGMMVVRTFFGQNELLLLSRMQSFEELQQLQATTSHTMITLVSLVVAMIFFVLFWVNYDGATPGKKLMAIKIVKSDGSKLTYSTAFIRYLGMFVSSFFFGLGYLWVIWDKRKQAWHDKMANTIVIKTDQKPKTALAILIASTTIIFYVFYMGTSVYYGIRLGMQEANRGKINLNSQSTSTTSSSGVNSNITMSPEAKIHFDRSQDLFKQIKEQSDDRIAVRKLNDKNIEELKAALTIEPDNPRIWYELGNAYTWVSTNGSLEDSLSAYKKAEELEPNNVVYINAVGDSYIRLGDYDNAVLQFQKTLRLTNKSGYAHLSLGRAYKALKINDLAREHFQKAIELFMTQNKNGQFDNEILIARKELAALAN